MSDRRLFPAVVSLLLLLAACGGDDPMEPVDPPKGGIQATVPPEGATYDFTTADGFTVTVTFPAGAVQSPQEVSITSDTPSGDSWVDLQFAPEGLILLEPAEVVLAAPEGVSVEDQVLHWGAPDDPVLVPTTADEAQRTLTTEIRSFGIPGAALVMPGSGGASPMSGSLGSAQGPGAGNRMGTQPIPCTQVVARAEAEFERFRRAKDFEAAIRSALASAETLQLRACPAEANRFIELAAEAGCEQMALITQEAIDTPITAYGQFEEQVRPAVHWAAQMQNLDPQCPTVLGLGAFIEGQVEDFLAFYSVQLMGFAANDLGTFQDLKMELARIWHLWADSQALGVGPANRILERGLYPTFDRLREIAYTMARDDGWHYPLSRLTATGWMAGRDIIGVPTPRPCDDYFTPPRCPNVPQVARYDDADIFADLQYAGTNVILEGRTPADSVLGSARAGGNLPGSRDDRPVLDCPTRGTLRLRGLLRAFTCWEGVEADREVIVAVNGNDVLTLRRPVGGDAYLDVPAEIDIVQAAQAVGIVPREGSFAEVSVRRTRTDCDERLWGPPTFEIFRARLNWRNPTLAVDVQFPSRVEPGKPAPVDVRVAVVDPFGVPAYFDGVDVSLSANGGTLASSGGTTDAQGWFRTTFTPSATTLVQQTVTVQATADSFEGVRGTDQSSAIVGALGTARIGFVSLSGRARVAGHTVEDDRQKYDTTPDPWSFVTRVEIDTTTAAGSFQAVADLDSRVTISSGGGSLSSVTGSIRASTSLTTTGAFDFVRKPQASSDAEWGIQFVVEGGGVPYTLTGNSSMSGTYDTWLELNGDGISEGYGRTRPPDVPPGSVSASGVLPPGEYSLDVFGLTGEGCTECSTDSNLQLDFTFTLGGSTP